MAIQWLNQALCFYQNLCLVDSESLRNRHLRVAANRYGRVSAPKTPTGRKYKIINFNPVYEKVKIYRESDHKGSQGV